MSIHGVVLSFTSLRFLNFRKANLILGMIVQKVNWIKSIKLRTIGIEIAAHIAYKLTIVSRAIFTKHFVVGIVLRIIHYTKHVVNIPADIVIFQMGFHIIHNLIVLIRDVEILSDSILFFVARGKSKSHSGYCND